MTSDILTELREFLLKGGIEIFIYNFKNPCIEAEINNQAKYDEATDSLTTHHYGWTDENGIEYSDEFDIVVTLESSLKKKLQSYKSSIISVINTVNYNIRIEDKDKVAQLTRYLKVVYEDIIIIKTEFNNTQIFKSYKTLFNEFFEELLSQTTQDSARNNKSAPKSKTVTIIKVKTFDLVNQNFRIAKFHSNLLVSPSLIDPISPNDFKKLFSNKEESITINWKGQVNQLSYLIRRLIDGKIINKYGAWETAVNYFTVKGKFVPNLKGSDDISLKTKKTVDSLFPL
jgi:hypothetical protein